MDISKHEFLHDRVLIKPEPVKERESGIISSTDTSKLPPIGIVIAVGNCSDGYNMTAKVGDKVKYERHCGDPYQEDFLLMREANIISIIND